MNTYHRVGMRTENDITSFVYNDTDDMYCSSLLEEPARVTYYMSKSWYSCSGVAQWQGLPGHVTIASLQQIHLDPLNHHLFKFTPIHLVRARTRILSKSVTNCEHRCDCCCAFCGLPVIISTLAGEHLSNATNQTTTSPLAGTHPGHVSIASFSVYLHLQCCNRGQSIPAHREIQYKTSHRSIYL